MKQKRSRRWYGIHGVRGVMAETQILMKLVEVAENGKLRHLDGSEPRFALRSDKLTVSETTSLLLITTTIHSPYGSPLPLLFSFLVDLAVLSSDKTLLHNGLSRRPAPAPRSKASQHSTTVQIPATSSKEL
ncbi:hypothetical protein H0H87_010970 [Tephrocybe sp. NHM501043]|nr:hypothetical protein H0H87_010970 [Tephrocybe sp. NHM501043]